VGEPLGAEYRAPVADRSLLDDLDGRGLIHDSTDRAALAARLSEGPITLYAGFDPTADSLHVGHLVPLLLLRRFQDHGHHPIALAGGATGMIGDPSGRSEERNLLDAQTLAANVAAIKNQLAPLLSGGSWMLADNHEWTGPVPLLDFLRDVGKHFTVNQMVAKESVKARMESDQGISYTEFSYMLLQANDYLELHRRHGCELQVGGSDQWGNITAGIDLIRRRAGASAHGLTCPLVMRSDGRKFGKSEGENVWLSPVRTPVNAFFHYWINVDDRDAVKFLRVLTLRPLEEIAAIEAEAALAPEKRIAQWRLAREVTALVHGRDAADSAAQAEQAAFAGDDPAALSIDALTQMEAELPMLEIGSAQLAAGLDLVDALTASGLVKSKSDARRAIQQGGAYVNGHRAADGTTLREQDLLHARWILLRRGKREHALVVVKPA
jgi:tyrosyl-tRNA synthetase